MEFSKDTLLLYAVTERSHLGTLSLLQAAEEALKNGITLLQLREKHMPYEELLALAKAMKDLAQTYGVPLIINDRPDIALASQADGVHMGQQDGSVKEARKILGPHKIIGVTARSVEQALQAQEDGANYLGIGAMFPSSTKDTASITPRETLIAIAAATSLPFVVIGGIKEDNIRTLKGLGASGAAVVSAIFGGEDVAQRTKTMRTLCEEVFCYV